MNINEIVSTLEELVVKVKTLEVKLAKLTATKSVSDNA
jgi:hypothetical protein